MDKDTKDVLVALYNKLWDNINNKDTRLWTFLSIYGGAVAVTFTIGRVTNLELYASLVILILTLWALFIVANATWWDLRNRLMIGGIERRFPDAMRGVVPSFYETLRVPRMGKLNDASVMVLSLLALAMYLRATWPFFRENSITSWEILLPLSLLYLFVGLAAWWWIDRVEVMVQEYYRTARQLREDAPPPPEVPTQTAERGSPTLAPLEAAVQEAADAVAAAAKQAMNARPKAEQAVAAGVSDAAGQSVTNAVDQAVRAAAGQLTQAIRDAVRAAADAVASAAEQAAQPPTGQPAAAAATAVSSGARQAVDQAVEAAVRRQIFQQDLQEFPVREKEARAQVGWRVPALILLVVSSIVFDVVCLQSASAVGWVYAGMGLQVVAAGFYIYSMVRYYYFPGGSLEDFHLRFRREKPDGRQGWNREPWPWLILTFFLAGAASCVAAVAWWGRPLPLYAAPTTGAELRTEREKLADQIESLRKRSVELDEKLRKKDLANFLRRSDADQFLTKDEAKQTYAPKTDLEAIRRNLPPKKSR